MARVLVVGDSLSMVRPESGIDLQALYSFQLQARLGRRAYVVNASVRANTSRMIVSETYFRSEAVAPARPDIVILQIGVVDCSPRVFRETERKLLAVASEIPLARNIAARVIAWRSARRYDFTRKHSFSLVPLDEYAANLERFLDQVLDVNPRCWFILLPIACPTGRMVERNFGIVEIVRRYNEVAQRAVTARRGAVVDFFEFTRARPDVLLSDGYHIDAAAHRHLAAELESLIDPRLSRSHAPATVTV